VAEAIIRDIERHERLLYGGNGEGVGLNARVGKLEDFVEEFRAERKEAASDRRKILVSVISGILIQIFILIGVLLWTHPAVMGTVTGVTPIP
jgi:F0F1-type ATP synthase assembly protein I